MRRVKSSNVALTEYGQRNENDRLSRLSHNVATHILKYLHAQDLLSLTACSRLWYRRCADNDLWLSFCEKEGVYTKGGRSASRSPLPWKALSNKIRSFSPFSLKVNDDSDIPPGFYKKAYLRSLNNWNRGKCANQFYHCTQRLGTRVKGEYVLAWSSSDVLIICKRTKKTSTVNVDNIDEVRFFDRASKFAVLTKKPDKVFIKTFFVDPVEPLRSFEFPCIPEIDLRNSLSGHFAALNQEDKIVVYNLQDGSTVLSIKTSPATSRLTEFDGKRIASCSKDTKKLEICTLKEGIMRTVDQCTEFKLLSDIKQVIVFYVRWKCDVYNVDTMEKLETLTASCGDFADIHNSLHYRGRTLVGLMGGPPGTGQLFPVINVWNFDGKRWVDRGVIVRGNIRDVGFVSSYLFLCETRKSERNTGRFQLWHMRKAKLITNITLPLDLNTTVERPLHPRQLNGSTVAVVTRDGVVVGDFN